MAFVFVLLTGIMFVAYTQSATFSNDVTASQLQKVGNEIVDAVNTAYYAGPPTKKTIKLYFPNNIKEIEIAEQTIVFTVSGVGEEYEYAVFASTNMSGTLRTFSGLHTVTVTAQENIVNISDG